MQISRKTSTHSLVVFAYGFPGGASGKEPPAKAGDVRDMGSIPESGISPGGGNGNLLQYSCLKNIMYREVWWDKVNGLTKSQTQLVCVCTHTHTHYTHMGS